MKLRTVVAAALSVAIFFSGCASWQTRVRQAATSASAAAVSAQSVADSVLPGMCRKETAKCGEPCAPVVPLCGQTPLAECAPLLSCCPEIKQCIKRRDVVSRAISSVHAGAYAAISAADAGDKELGLALAVDIAARVAGLWQLLKELGIGS